MVISRDQEETKLNNAINMNSGAHTLTHDKKINISFNKTDIETTKSK